MITFPKQKNRLNIHYFSILPNGITGLLKFKEDFKSRADPFYEKHKVRRPDPLRNLLVVPATLQAYDHKLRKLEELKQKGHIDKIMFDSGGFEAMSGRIAFEDLIDKNEYRYNNYEADIYVAPDFPALGYDNEIVYNQKVKKTLEGTWQLYERLKPEVKDKYAPAFHQRELWDINLFWDCYEPIIQRSKFATYSAASLTKGIRALDAHSMNLIEELVQRLDSIGASLHVLGMSSPPTVYTLAKLGVRTYDSSSYLQAGANGQILFPYYTGFKFSDRRSDSISIKEAAKLQETTKHICPYCEDLKELRDNSEFRQKHNAIVTEELAYTYYGKDQSEIEKRSPKFERLLKSEKQMSLF